MIGRWRWKRVKENIWMIGVGMSKKEIIGRQRWESVLENDRKMELEASVRKHLEDWGGKE